jgi:GNAT superfamily N-acetyltransferase
MRRKSLRRQRNDRREDVMPEYMLTLTDMPDPADVEVVKRGLDTYDAAQGAAVDWVPLALFARDEAGAIVAGLTGSTYWGYLYVGRLWTDERVRKTGLGSRLLLEAEQEAVRRGCHSVHLMTGSFNALPFYQKRGYAVFGKLADMPPGHTQHFMCKRLGQ